MKKISPYAILVLVATFLLSITLTAQETTVTVKVEKDGELVKDTTYKFDDPTQAKHAIKMMEVMSGDDEHMMEYHYDMEEGHGDFSHGKHVMVMKSGDGETFDILINEECENDSVVTKNVKVIVTGDEHGHEDFYITTGEDTDVIIKEIIEEHGEGENVKVIVVKKKVDGSEEDHDEEVEVEVKVEKEVKKKKK